MVPQPQRMLYAPYSTVTNTFHQVRLASADASRPNALYGIVHCTVSYNLLAFEDAKSYLDM